MIFFQSAYKNTKTEKITCNRGYSKLKHVENSSKEQLLAIARGYTERRSASETAIEFALLSF